MTLNFLRYIRPGYLRRRFFGKWTIDDPRPIAEASPYTYYLPSENELLALQPGDQVKLIFRPEPPGEKWDAERMWVTITAVRGEMLDGVLDNTPFDMPQIRCGAVVHFRQSDVIDRIWNHARTVQPPPAPKRREYWDRCMVDACVIGGESPVDYLYREDPDLAETDDTFPDSGWRIRGTDDGIAEDGRCDRPPAYVALGVVLNRDDRWLHLIDSPIGARFIRDPDTDRFTECAPT